MWSNLDGVLAIAGAGVGVAAAGFGGGGLASFTAGVSSGVELAQPIARMDDSHGWQYMLQVLKGRDARPC